jgi:hypothetical protein
MHRRAFRRDVARTMRDTSKRGRPRSEAPDAPSARGRTIGHDGRLRRAERRARRASTRKVRVSPVLGTKRAVHSRECAALLVSGISIEKVMRNGHRKAVLRFDFMHRQDSPESRPQGGKRPRRTSRYAERASRLRTKNAGNIDDALVRRAR